MDFIEEAHKKYGQHERYVEARTVAAYLGVSISSVYKMSWRGTLPSHKIGRFLRFRLTEVEKAIQPKAKGK